MHVIIVVIAQEGSFSRAAKILHIAQPSLSRRVSLIEKGLGVKLFERSTRRVELTRAGRLFVQESGLSLNHAERAWDLAHYQAQIENGPYRIGYSPYIHSAFLPILNSFSSLLALQRPESPGIVLESATTLEMVTAVLRNRMHAAVGIGPIITDEDLWVQTVGREGFTICMHKNHRLARKGVLTINDLDGEMLFWIPRSLQPRFYNHITRYIRSFGVQPVFREVRAAAHALEFAAQSFGLAMLPRSVSRISRPGTIFKPLSDRYLGIEIMLFMRRDQRYGYIKQMIDDLYARLVALKIEIS